MRVATDLFPPSASALVVAFSGGADSTALLHWLKQHMPQTRLRAIHVNHQTNEHASEWAEHCHTVCERLGVVLEIGIANCRSASETDLRQARYQLFEQTLQANEVLLTAHHQDDQAETFLLRALRGSGVRGLAGIPARRRLGPGWLVRPMLRSRHSDSEAYCSKHGLPWLEDPSNQIDHADRNFLRLNVMPRLAERWPHAVSQFSRSADQLASSQHWQDSVTARDLARLHVSGNAISAEGFLANNTEQRHQLIALWCQQRAMPSMPRSVEARLDDLAADNYDQSATLQWPGARLCRFRDEIHLLGPASVEPGADLKLAASLRALPKLPEGCGELRLVGDRTPAAEDLPVQIRFAGYGRPGRPSLQLRPAGRHLRAIKHWFQEAGIPPWDRPFVPLIFESDELLAMADLYLCERLQNWLDEQKLSLRWLTPNGQRSTIGG